MTCHRHSLFYLLFLPHQAMHCTACHVLGYLWWVLQTAGSQRLYQALLHCHLTAAFDACCLLSALAGVLVLLLPMPVLVQPPDWVLQWQTLLLLVISTPRLHPCLIGFDTLTACIETRPKILQTEQLAAKVSGPSQTCLKLKIWMTCLPSLRLILAVSAVTK